jgi:glycyl-tRNA synthetase
MTRYVKGGLFVIPLAPSPGPQTARGPAWVKTNPGTVRHHEPARGCLQYHPRPVTEQAPTIADVVTMDKIVALCKRRGFIFPSSEIYGGVGSTYDFGHYGVLLKGNVKNEWWRAMLQQRDDIVALDSAILQHPRVWEASGHLAGFTDPLVDCKTCGQRFRADHLGDLPCGRKPSKHPGETDECELTEARDFNLMFETTIGPVKESGSVAYLRPETAQGIFVNFKNVLQFSRKKPPFGIAQIGKSFRNEITPGNFIFRTREFEQMEMEFFVPPDAAQTWFEHWLEERMRWYVKLGIRPDHLRLRAHDQDELSHYSSGTSDVEYLFPIGWSELEGIANRGDFDLKQHAEFSGEKLEYFDPNSGERYVPHVIEPAAGADRATLAFLVDAYDEEVVQSATAADRTADKGGRPEETRTVLRLHPRIAPVKVAVMPLVKKDGQPELAREIYEDLRGRMQSEYDEGGSIGKRYRRQDEIGTPWGVTVDHQSLEDGTVTLRDRDSLAQERLKIDDLPAELERRLAAPWRSPKLEAI